MRVISISWLLLIYYLLFTLLCFSSNKAPKKKPTVEDVLQLFEVDPIRVNIREMYPGVKCQAPHNGNMCVFEVVLENTTFIVSEDLVPCHGCKEKMKHLLSARVVVRDVIKAEKILPKGFDSGESQE